MEHRLKVDQLSLTLTLTLTLTLIQDDKIISAYKRNKNLKDHLVKSKLPDINTVHTQGPGFYKQATTVRNTTTDSHIHNKTNTYTRYKKLQYML